MRLILGILTVWHHLPIEPKKWLNLIRRFYRTVPPPAHIKLAMYRVLHPWGDSKIKSGYTYADGHAVGHTYTYICAHTYMHIHVHKHTSLHAL